MTDVQMFVSKPSPPAEMLHSNGMSYGSKYFLHLATAAKGVWEWGAEDARMPAIESCLGLGASPHLQNLARNLLASDNNFTYAGPV